MDAFTDWDDPALTLPVRGRPVRIPAPPADVALRLRHRMLALNGAKLGRVDEDAAIRSILGADLYGRLAHELPEAHLLHLGRTALLHWCGGADAGLAHWDPVAAWEKARELDPIVDESAPGFMGPDDPGGGPIIDREAQVRAWFNSPTQAPAKTEELRLTWRDIFTCWDDVDIDMQQVFHIDMRSGVLAERPWPWLENRIRELAMTPGTRLQRAILAPLYPKDTPAS